MDKSTGITHSRVEAIDFFGVAHGYYEVLEPDCVVRRVQFNAEVSSGFRVLSINKRNCDELPVNQNKQRQANPGQAKPKTVPKPTSEKQQFENIDGVAINHPGLSQPKPRQLKVQVEPQQRQQFEQLKVQVEPQQQQFEQLQLQVEPHQVMPRQHLPQEQLFDEEELEEGFEEQVEQQEQNPLSLPEQVELEAGIILQHPPVNPTHSVPSVPPRNVVGSVETSNHQLSTMKPIANSDESSSQRPRKRKADRKS